VACAGESPRIESAMIGASRGPPPARACRALEVERIGRLRNRVVRVARAGETR
jgi:hypothetical protein